MPSIRDDRKVVIAGIVLASITAMLLIAANLPYQYAAASEHWAGVAEVDGMMGFGSQVLPRMAGWPYRYSVQYPSDGEHWRYWSTLRLFTNVSIAIAICGIVFAIAQIRVRRIASAGNPRRMQTLFDIGLACLIVLVPSVMVMRWHFEWKEHQRIAQRINRSGNCFMSAWLPAPMVDRLPRGLVDRLSRVRRVQCVAADNALIGTVCRLPTLTLFESFYGRFEGQAMTPLIDRIHLAGFTLANQSLSTADIDVLVQLPWVSSICMKRTNVDSAMIARTGSMTSLRTISLANTDVRLSELGRPQWAEKVKELQLSRPPQGTSDSLTIDGWPNLESLTVTRRTDQPNDETLTLRLVNLPKLETLRIDRIQKHSLHAENLPRLTSIGDVVTQESIMSSQNLRIPGLPRYQDLTLKNLPGLVRVTCFAGDLQTLVLEDLPRLRELSLSVFITSSAGDFLGKVSEPERVQEWMDTIGQCDVPAKLILSGLPLQGVDFSGLAGNAGIRHLTFNESTVSFDQVQSLQPMKNLTKLDVGCCAIQDDQLSWIVQQFPELSLLRINGSQLTEINLQGHENLRFLDLGPLVQLDQLGMTDQPNLSLTIRIEHPLSKFEIRHARSVQGLAVTYPWPASAVLTGLRDLNWFSAGGPEVGDSLFQELAQCPGLDQLTLAYPSLSVESLRNIGQMIRLTVLILPGTDLDDSVTDYWQQLDSLWEINLDDTRVDIRTIAWLSSIESLRSVSLNRVPLSESAISVLCEMRQLARLSLRGVDLTNQDIRHLLANESLEVLDLSDSKLDSRALDTIAESSSLKTLIVHQCNLTQSDIARLFQSNLRIAVDLGDFDSEPLAQFNPQVRSEIQRRIDSLQKTSWAYRSIRNQNDPQGRSTPSAKTINGIDPMETAPPLLAEQNAPGQSVPDQEHNRFPTRVADYPYGLLASLIDPARIDVQKFRRLPRLPAAGGFVGDDSSALSAQATTAGRSEIGPSKSPAGDSETMDQDHPIQARPVSVTQTE